MAPRIDIAWIRQILLWAAASSLSGAVVGLAVGVFKDGSIESPTVVISVLFGNVVGFTALSSNALLLRGMQNVSQWVRGMLLGLALLAGSIAGSIAVLTAYPLFVLRDPRQTIAIVAINGVLALIVGGVVFAYEGMQHRLRESLRVVEEVRLVESRLREERARAELSALQARINPHFFFNTLNTISSLVAEDPEEAEEVVLTLADLFRYTFKVADTGPVPLHEEIGFTRNYLEIEKARFGDRLSVEWDLDIDADPTPVPGLILQPLVENAVAHGIAPRATGGRITVRTRRIDQTLHLDVIDDGVGIAAETQPFEEGHGLDNVQRRIQAFYRGRGSITLARVPGKSGTIARIRIPTELETE